MALYMAMVLINLVPPLGPSMPTCLRILLVMLKTLFMQSWPIGHRKPTSSISFMMLMLITLLKMMTNWFPVPMPLLQNNWNFSKQGNHHS
jgi:hypothetical protein